jgi:hypothetical protein
MSDVGNALKKLFGGKADPKNVHIQRSKSLDQRKRTTQQEPDIDDADSEESQSTFRDEEASDTDSKQSDRDDEQDEETTDTDAEQSDRSDERSETTNEHNPDKRSSLTFEFRDEVDEIMKALLNRENKKKHIAAIKAVRELIITMCDSFEDLTDTRRK